MKKISAVLASLMLVLLSANAFATIKVIGNGGDRPNHEDYLGKIVNVIYAEELGQPVVTIMTLRDKQSDSNLKALHVTIDGKDLPFGMVLASSLGKKIALYGGPQLEVGSEIKYFQIVTDEYWHPSNK